ncbi:MAG: 16S rRNA (guanine(527)-N(7))-methyltransferase RsmG [Thermodesulfobacteriota bacterium]|nr:16S rRNA (guanine(527)-N(7))-methyltransferase RsmG [Thermodesulfobacteriota bacterium]
MNFKEQWKKIVKKGACELGIKLDASQLELMALHGSELVKWNKKINITSITDPFETAVRHFIDSVAMANHIPDNMRVLDIGSGGGFPGLPLKITNPTLDVVMADSLRKRISFIKHVIRSARLADVDALHTRCEDLAKTEGFTHSFDIVVSRAFTSLDRFVSLAEPFLSENGVILAMKGKSGQNEIKSLCTKKNDINIHNYLLPFEKHERSIVIVKPGNHSD